MVSLGAVLKSNKKTNFLLFLRKYLYLLGIIAGFMRLRTKLSILVSIIMLLSFGLTFYRTAAFQDELVFKQTERQARMLARQILLTRKWVADHDGLFFMKKPGVESNPFLSESAIKDLEGHTYVKRNPAMVTRELSEYASQVDFCQFRVTSLKPVNPDNAPDDFEREGLTNFDKGTKELIKTVNTENGRVMRYMTPLKVEESCLSCHAEHGYKAGDIRGALSLTIPIAWADQAISANNKLLLAIGGLTIMITGLAIFLLIDFLIVRRLDLLSDAIDNYPEQDIEDQILPGGQDEISDLSNNFKYLAKRLTASQSELERTREQMFQREKMAAIGQLAAGIAHEVNNPLSGMRNCVKSIQEAPANEEMRERYLVLIDKGLKRIGHIVRQLLNFGSKEPLHRRLVDIDETIKECFELLDYQMKDINLQLDLNINDHHLIDAEAVKQAVVNIGLNAAQAMPEGGRLTVTSHATTDSISISISDTGPGVPPEAVDRIFEPFFTTKEIGEGTGLGLAVSFSLVEKMGGEIIVESSSDQGAKFTINIPTNNKKDVDND
jgi:signal transduction histidine kinase